MDNIMAFKGDINSLEGLSYCIITPMETPKHYWISFRQKINGKEHIIKEWEAIEEETPTYYEYKKSLNIPQENTCYTFTGWKPYFDY